MIHKSFFQQKHTAKYGAAVTRINYIRIYYHNGIYIEFSKYNWMGSDRGIDGWLDFIAWFHDESEYPKPHFTFLSNNGSRTLPREGIHNYRIWVSTEDSLNDVW